MVPASLSLLRTRDFGLLFAGQCVSVAGDAVTTLALAFAVLDLTGSPASLGIVLGASAIAFAAAVLVGGVVADRLPRRLVMLTSDLVRGTMVSLIAADLLAGTARVWHLVVLMAIYGAADAFFRPAAVGLMPQVVTTEQLQAANALNGLTFSTGGVLGPALAGILIALTSPATALVFDAASFLVSALTLFLIRPRPSRRDETPRTLAEELRGGWREVRSRSWILAFLVALMTYHVLVVPAILVLGPTLSKAELDGPSSWAIIVTGFGVGTVIGHVVAVRVRSRRPMVLVTLLLVVASAQPAIIGSGLGTSAIAMLEVSAGLAIGLLFTIWETALQHEVPEEALSRVSSYDFFACSGLMPVGLAVIGPAAATFGLHATLDAVAAVTITLVLVVALLPATRSLGSRSAVTDGS